MITLSNVNNFNRTLSFFGLSSDTKPTGIFVQDEVSRYSVTNGSVFVEIDTGDEYMFDDASDTWVKIDGGGSGASGGVKREIVNTLPTTNIDPNTIYLMADSDGSGDNTYIEYMYVNDAWEALGSYIPDIWGRGTGTNSAVLKGDNNTATGTSAIAIGQYSSATNTASFAEGLATHATGAGAHSEGESSAANGYASHTEGFYTNAAQTAAHAEGMNTQAKGQGSHAEGKETTASENFAHSEGLSTTASAMAAHAEGNGASATQTGAHAEGAGTTASGQGSHAEGAGTKASGVQSHAEGGGTRASGNQSHSEGSGTVASGDGSHAEGGGTTASGSSSHAEGGGTTASGWYSHAEGGQTIANHKSQHVFGEYNIEDGSSALGTEHGNYIEIVGNGGIPDGGSAIVRSNARTLDWNGNEWLAGNVSVEDVMLPLEDGSNTRTSLLDKLDSFISVEDGAEDQVPYTFRASGGGHKIGNREIDQLVGGTVTWNQLMPVKSGTYSGTDWNVTFNADGSWTIAVTAETASSNSANATLISGFIVGHKYAWLGKKLNIDVRIKSNSVDMDTVFNCTTTGYSNIGVTFTNLAQGTYTLWPMLFDLTQMFGTTIADYIYALETATPGAGVAWFKRLFGADYYPFDSGTLKSVEGVSAHVTRGFNQWDEQWELGGIDINTGEDIARTDRIRNTGYIPVIPGARYYFKKPANSMSFRWYDANKTYVGSGSTSGDTYAERNAPSNASYLRFVIADATTYTPGTLCLNLSDPDKNGTYEPYVSHTYPLDSTLTLRGILKLDSANRLYYDGDRYASDRTVTRRFGVATVDGTNITVEAWGCTNPNSYPVYVSLPNYARSAVVANAFSDNFVATVDDATTMQSMTFIGGSGASSTISFGLLRGITSAQEANEWFAAHPTTIIYELTTPTTETADPFTNPQIVDASGTEEYVTTGILPVGHYTIYPTDIVTKVNGLPSDFSTLIAPTETAYKATRAYSVNQFLIVNNQLYRVTASIASGATITPGTNVTACTIADILTQLLNA